MSSRITSDHYFMTTHAEIPVKVNALVDRGVAPLVAAISEFPGLLTLDSCEGEADGTAYCYVSHQGPVTEFVRVLGDIAAYARQKLGGCCDEYKITLEWLPGDEAPMAKIASQQAYIDLLADALTELAAKTVRMNQSNGDS